MKHSTSLLISAVGAVGLFWSVSASAMVLGPDSAYDTSEENGALHPNDVAAIFGTSDLEQFYKANFDQSDEEGPYKPFYSTTFSGDPNDALITWDGPEHIICPECYLVVKDGNEPQYLFDLGNWDGQEELDLQGFYPDQGAISHVAIFGKSYASVPEPGTLGLLGLGILGLMTVRRKVQ